ncbi:uncharacterized protein LOC135806310 [Sycon ciliatum]|uniref:uncharacterized protein LOC135806310 n=1 Tax=Sycon ciliatum TaxID=27933 RepID=UPI0020A983B9|eukprot:scpid25372/ scgid5549/ Ankyrin repeat domain-containing protein 53
MLRMSACEDLSTAGLQAAPVNPGASSSSNNSSYKPAKRSATAISIGIGGGAPGTGGRHHPASSSQQRRRSVRFTASPGRSQEQNASLSEDETQTRKPSTRQQTGSSGWLVTMGPSARQLFKSKPPSSILMACSSGDARWLKHCLSSSAEDEVNQLGPEGLSPLHMAARHGHLSCIETLLSWKATIVTVTTLPDSRTALHLAIDAKRQRVQCLRRLVQAGIPIDQGDWNMSTPLHTAAQLGRVACMMVLLESGANNQALDKLKRQPVDVAKWSGKGECVRRLTAVAWAAEKTHAEETKRLHAYSSDIERVHRTRQQKLEQALRGEEAFGDWLAAKGLASTSSASLSHQHTTSSLHHISGTADVDDRSSRASSRSGTTSMAASRVSSRLSSKFNSMWSVYSAPPLLPASMADGGRSTLSRLASPSLPFITTPDEFPPPPAASKPIKISFQHRHQHGHLLKASKSQHSGVSPKSKAKRTRHSGAARTGHTGHIAASRRKESKQRPLPRASTPHPSRDMSSVGMPPPPPSPPVEESMVEIDDEERPDLLLPSVRIEELLMKDRHQLPTLKPLAWGSGHQLLDPMATSDDQQGNESAKQRPQAMPVFRPLRANSLRLAALRSTNLEAVDEEGESASSSVSDIDAYLGPTHSCLQLQSSDGIDTPVSGGTGSDISLCSTDMLDRMSLSDD